MGDFKELRVWQAAVALADEVYRATGDMPMDERFGLRSQARRAASSVAANIAEGCARGTDPDFLRFLRYARGSAAELESHLLLAVRVGALESPQSKLALAQVDSISRMLLVLMRQLAGRTPPQTDEGARSPGLPRPSSLVSRP